MKSLVNQSFRSQALSFPSKVDAALAEIETIEQAKGMLDKASAMAHYAGRLKAGIDIERPIALGVLKIKAKLGELMPRGKVGAGRGHTKNGKAALPFSKPIVVAYRKLSDNMSRI